MKGEGRKKGINEFKNLGRRILNLGRRILKLVSRILKIGRILKLGRRN